jgi:DNA-binding NtrC family response regulator
VADKASVLIVEDEDSIRLTLRDYLKKVGYTVYVASEGTGAIQQLLDNDIEVIVSDYRMSVFGGHYWIKFLERYCSEKKIIIISGYLQPDFSIPFTTLRKPFDYDDLTKLIEEKISQ